MRVRMAGHARLVQSQVGDVPMVFLEFRKKIRAAVFRRMALFAGELRVRTDQPIDHVRVLERSEILPFPGHFVEERKIGPVVLGVAFRAFGFMGFRQIVMVSLVGLQLLLDFRMAAQASGIHARSGVTFLAVHDVRRSGDRVMRPRQGSRRGAVNENVSHHAQDQQAANNQRDRTFGH